MNKAELVAQVAEKTGFTKKDAEAALDGVLETISEVLTKGDSVTFVGFGTFSVTERAARTAKVPSTGKEVKVPAKKVVKFKVGKNFKDAVANCKSCKKK